MSRHLHSFFLASLVSYCWLRLIDHLQLEWSVNEQYGYGFAVPFLCGLLIYRRLRSIPFSPHSSASTAVTPVHTASAFQFFSFSTLLLLFLLTRWIEVANPDWRLLSWMMALEVIGISIIAGGWIGTDRLRSAVAFPLLFFLVAVPWPTFAEHFTVQNLTRGIVALTVEVLQLAGHVAIARGNVIETVRGFVDVDEACSGIRSLQASLMLALFFGEWHRFNFSKRVLLVAVAALLACVCNLARTVVLSFVAAEQGTPAIQKWHDPAGVFILVACFCGIWAVSARFARKHSFATDSQGESTAKVPSSTLEANVVRRPSLRDLFLQNPSPLLRGVVLAGVLLLVVGEVAIHFWYAPGESVKRVAWSVIAPDGVNFQRTELPPSTRSILRYDEALTGTWQSSDHRWQLIYVRWYPGRVAITLARNHTPEICLPAAGRKLTEISDPFAVETGPLRLLFRCYTASTSSGPMFVFYSLTEDGAATQSLASDSLTWSRRMQAVLHRRKNPGQRVVEIALTGPATRAEAEQLLRSELPRLIRVD